MSSHRHKQLTDNIYDDCLCFPDRCHFDPLPHQAEERQSIEELDQAAFDVLDPSLIRFV